MRKSFASLLTAQKEPRPLYKGRGLIPVLPPFFPQGSHNCGSCSTASGAIRATAENKNCAPGCRSVSALRYCPAITVSFRYGLQEPSGPSTRVPFCHKAPGCIRNKLSARLSSTGCFLCVPLTATCSLPHLCYLFFY